MSTTQLQALLEFDSGVFHAFQSQRFDHLPQQHRAMADAQGWLIDKGLIHSIGDEFILSADGQLLLEVVNAAAEKHLTEYGDMDG